MAVAVDLRSRLLGLVLLEREEAGRGLLIPGCAAVHGIGMRFALDLVFLDGAGKPMDEARLRPWRFAACRGAAAVLEVPAGAPG